MTLTDQPAILVIDQAAHSGWAYGSGCVEVWGGVVFDGALGKRLFDFHDWAGSLIEKWQPDFIAHEGPLHRGRAATMHGYGYIGIIHMLAYEHTIGVIEGPRATEVKQWMTGDRSASKETMVEAVMSAGCMVNDDNDADAIALLMYLQDKGEISG